MYAEINARTYVDGEPKSSKGRTPRVYDPKPKISVLHYYKKDEYTRSWLINVKGESRYGTDGVEDVTTERKLTIQILPNEIFKIVWAAHKGNYTLWDLPARKERKRQLPINAILKADDDTRIAFTIELLKSLPADTIRDFISAFRSTQHEANPVTNGEPS